MESVIRTQDIWLVFFSFGLLVWYSKRPLGLTGIVLASYTSIVVLHGYGILRAIIHTVLMYAVWLVAKWVINKSVDNHALDY